MDKVIVTNLRALFDCEFYYKLLILIVTANNSQLMSLLSSFSIRQFTVFINELSSFIDADILCETSELFQKTNKAIRDKVHYFTSKPFSYSHEKNATEQMIFRIQSACYTRPKDNLYPFRNDISYIKVKDKILHSDIEMYSLLEGTPMEKKGQIIGKALKQYSYDLASIISNFREGFAETEISSIISLEDFTISPNAPKLDFCEGKFDVAVQQSGFSEYMTTLLLNILSDIGSLLYVINYLLDPCWLDTSHLYFLTRLIAIRFDEISDAIYRIENDFPEKESAQFIQTLKSHNIYPFPEKLRLVAKKLRNSIHYNPSNEIWNVNIGKSFYWHENFLKQASIKSYTLTVWPNDYLRIKDNMIHYLSLLHEYLSELFNF